MDKTALKKFAISIRTELISIVKTKVDYFTSLDILPVEYKEYESLINEIKEKASKNYEEFIEEVAYIWFNRFVAFRFMDIHNITDKKVISPANENETLPEIFALAKEGEIDERLNINTQKFYDILDKKINSKDSENECYRMLFIASCNYYSEIIPVMFEKIDKYTELLLPDDLLSKNSIRTKFIQNLNEENSKDIEVIGWLYQYYISEKKDEVFTKLKKNIKITPLNIPAATQLFTPHWIVKYLIENSLGRLWMLNNPNSSLKEKMRYYIDEESKEFIKISSPTELTIFDPCCGSGHMLTYAFDLLTLIYEEEGYNKSEIPALILENNIFGCDIDKRAATLANFALIMKARLYHKRFFRKKVNPKVIELKEYEDFKDIKNLGSLIKPENVDFEEGIFSNSNKHHLFQKQILTQTYSCVVTNPPYMGSKGMNKSLSDFVKKHYPDSKSDLFAVFMERGLEFTKDKGFMAMITMQSWMFLSSFEKLRTSILKNYKIITLAHLGNMVMGIAFGTSAFIIQKIKPNNKSKGVYFKIELKDLDEDREIKSLK